MIFGAAAAGWGNVSNTGSPSFSHRPTQIKLIHDEFSPHSGIEAWAKAVRRVEMANRGGWWIQHTCRGLIKHQNTDFETQVGVKNLPFAFLVE